MSEKTIVARNAIAFMEATRAYEDNMTLRDWFAGQALVAISNANLPIVAESLSLEGRAKMIAQTSYAIANALMNERDKK